MSNELVLELRAVLAAQRDMLLRVRAQVQTLEDHLEGVDQQAQDIAALEARLLELERESGLLQPMDLEDFNADIIPALLAQGPSFVQEQTGLVYTDWPSFVRQCRAYNAERGIDSLAPYENFLTDADYAMLRAESYEEQYRWDAWDYAAVGVAGVLAALTDLMLVRIPKSIRYAGRFDQQGSPLTAWIKRYDIDSRDDWFARWARALEKEAKVPYDASSGIVDGVEQTIGGMGGRSHRFQSLGHDPVLGFVFGILDILRGTITGFSYDKLTGTHKLFHGQVWSNREPVGLIAAFLTQLKHLISDVAAPMGLPAPFLPIFQAFNSGRFGPKGRSIGELARWMYLNGYDLRHFMVGALAPAMVEMVLRAFILIRHFLEHGEVKFSIAGNPKYRLMLLSAHGAAAVANAGKVALYQGNPLAINEAQWLAFERYLLPSMRYWLFDRERLKWEHLERLNEATWQDLELQSVALIEAVAAQSFPLVSLGEEQGSP